MVATLRHHRRHNAASRPEASTPEWLAGGIISDTWLPLTSVTHALASSAGEKERGPARGEEGSSWRGVHQRRLLKWRRRGILTTRIVSLIWRRSFSARAHLLMRPIAPSIIRRMALRGLDDSIIER